MSAGVINSQTRALEGVTGDAESAWVAIVITGEVLRVGRNTVAVEIHEEGQGSSDTSFDLEVIANPWRSRRLGPARSSCRRPAVTIRRDAVVTSRNMIRDPPLGSNTLTLG